MSNHHSQLQFLVFIICICALIPGIVSAIDPGNITPAQPDLMVTAISPNGGEVFAHEPNIINATIRNNGTSAAGPFNVRFRINGVDTLFPVTELASGATTSVIGTDPASRLNGVSVSINVMADPESAIVETDKTNNAKEITKTVVNNGYKGKRFTDGSDMTTRATFDLRGDLICSAKADYQGSGNWGSKTVTWTAADTPVPANKKVKEVRLYIPYNWDGDKIMPGGVTMSFNGNAVTPGATYTDTKGFGGYDYPSGLLVYTVTSQFSAVGSNTATITRTSSQKGPSLDGMILVVIYEDSSRTEKMIFINEEADILKRYEEDTWISPAEATTYAPFTGPQIELTRVASARLITISNSAKPGEGNLIFNGQTWTGIWQGGDDTTFGIDDRPVKEYLMPSGNGVQFRAGVTGDYFMPSNAILVVEYAGLITVTPTPEPASGSGSDSSSSDVIINQSAITQNVTRHTTNQSAMNISSPLNSDSARVVQGNQSISNATYHVDENHQALQENSAGNSQTRTEDPKDESLTNTKMASSDILVPIPVAVIWIILSTNIMIAFAGIVILVHNVRVKT